MTETPALHTAEATLEAVHTRRHRAYPEYRPSGIEWLGDVPEHWETIPVKYLCRLSGGFTPSTDNADYWDGEIPWVSPKDMKTWRILYTEDCVTQLAVSEKFRSTLKPGAVLLVVRSGILRHTLPVAINNVPVVINQDMKALVTQKRLFNEYLAWLIEGNQRSLLRLWTKPGTTVESIESEYLQNEKIPVPPLEEQRGIARFLDEQTEKIDALIGAKRDLLALLREKRQAVITNAVTKGLDPAAKLKPSGVEWLGDVPEHWVPKKLGYLVDMRGGSTPSKSNDDYWRGEIPWVSPKDMKSLVIEDSQDHISESALAETNLGLLRPPAVLMVVRGMILAHSFPVGITAVPVTINQDMKALLPRNGISSEYLLHLLNGIRNVVLGAVDESAHGTRVLRISQWKNITVFIPDGQEQGTICDHINATHRKYDDTIAEIHAAIDRLNEYRSALISAAVTGKIDVRGEGQ